MGGVSNFIATLRKRDCLIPNIALRDRQLTANCERRREPPRLVHDRCLPGHSHLQHGHHCILDNLAPTHVSKAPSSQIYLQKVSQKGLGHRLKEEGSNALAVESQSS